MLVKCEKQKNKKTQNQNILQTQKTEAQKENTKYAINETTCTMQNMKSLSFMVQKLIIAKVAMTTQETQQNTLYE